MMSEARNVVLFSADGRKTKAIITINWQIWAILFIKPILLKKQ